MINKWLGHRNIVMLIKRIYFSGKNLSYYSKLKRLLLNSKPIVVN